MPAIAAPPPVNTDAHAVDTTITPGYNALKLFLDDEKHLTVIRQTKKVFTFSGISETTTRLIDEIAKQSTLAIEELEKLASEKPAFEFEEYSDETIAIATLNSLRMTTAKEFLFNNEDFEKNLLISQLNVLRVISHLAAQLEEKEPNHQRKKWLEKLASRYEKFYQKVYDRLALSKIE